MVIYIDVASPGITLHPAPHRLIILLPPSSSRGLLWNFRMRSTHSVPGSKNAVRKCHVPSTCPGTDDNGWCETTLDESGVTYCLIATHHRSLDCRVMITQSPRPIALGMVTDACLRSWCRFHCHRHSILGTNVCVFWDPQ
jgi:hypothetical protein